MGTKIAWYNNQFYNNSDYDGTAALKVQKYEDVAGLIGPQQLLMGVSLNTAKGGDEGAETLSDMANSVIPPLKAKYGSQFGGVVGSQMIKVAHGRAESSKLSHLRGLGDVGSSFRYR